MKNFTLFIISLYFLSGCSQVNIFHSHNKITYTPRDINTQEFPFAYQYSNSTLKKLIQSLENNKVALLSSSRNDILNILGNPMIIKNVNLLTIWQYRGDCVLNIIWKKNNTDNETISLDTGNNKTNFTTNSNDPYKIVWIEALSKKKEHLNYMDCFNSMLY